MALVPIRIDHTSKPPIGTPLRSDGHWSVQGLVGVWAFNEGSGGTFFNVADPVALPGVTAGAAIISPAGLTGDGSSNAKGICPIAAAKLPGEAFTSLSIIRRVGSSAQYSKPLCVGAGSAPRIGLEQSSSTAGALVAKAYIGGSAKQTPSITNALALGDSTAITSMYDGAALTLRSGNLPAVSVAASGVIAYDSYGVCFLGRPDTATQNYPAEIPISVLYDSALPIQEQQLLIANLWQIFEPATVWVEVGGGAEAALFAGAIYGESSVSAQLSTAIAIASQVVASGSISGGINTAIRLATSAQGSASASALLTTAIRMAASAQGYGASTADLSTTVALAADILAASSASGALSTSIRFGGALSGSSTPTAALTNAITIAAQAVGLGSISGQLAGTVAAALFAGTISGSASASASLSTAVILAAAAQGSSTAQAALSTALELAAQANGISSATGALGSDISGLTGSLSGSSEAQATLSTAIHLMGLAAGQCGVVGRLAEPVEILAQLRVMASDPLALTISVRDPLALRVTVQ